MATIIRIDAPRITRRNAPPAPLPEGGARILFFTGVRYEKRPAERPARRRARRPAIAKAADAS